MPVSDDITLTVDGIAVAVAPAEGGRLSQLSVDGTPLLIGRSDDLAATGWGCYPMVPWAGRIRHGRFEFDGVVHQLPINFETHAIHGVGYTSEWDVVDRDESSLELALDLPTDGRWPFGGSSTQRIEIDPEGVTLSMRVRAGDAAFPVSFGWHPWFVKPDSIDFHPTAMYPRDDEWIALPTPVAVRPPPWDDAFVNTEPVEVTIGGRRLRLTSDCSIWVVFDMRAHATCIEPQTAPPDAANIAPRRLDPGESLAAWYRIARA